MRKKNEYIYFSKEFNPLKSLYIDEEHIFLVTRMEEKQENELTHQEIDAINNYNKISYGRELYKKQNNNDSVYLYYLKLVTADEWIKAPAINYGEKERAWKPPYCA